MTRLQLKLFVIVALMDVDVVLLFSFVFGVVLRNNVN